jgi:hypothetical protein
MPHYATVDWHETEHASRIQHQAKYPVEAAEAELRRWVPRSPSVRAGASRPRLRPRSRLDGSVATVTTIASPAYIGVKSGDSYDFHLKSESYLRSSVRRGDRMIQLPEPYPTAGAGVASSNTTISLQPSSSSSVRQPLLATRVFTEDIGVRRARWKATVSRILTDNDMWRLTCTGEQR